MPRESGRFRGVRCEAKPVGFGNVPACLSFLYPSLQFINFASCFGRESAGVREQGLLTTASDEHGERPILGGWLRVRFAPCGSNPRRRAGLWGQ